MRPRKDDPYWLIRYVAISAGEGIAAGWVLLLILIYMDIGGLGSLVHSSDTGAVALIVLLVSFAVTFGVVGIGIRVMFDLPKDMDGGDE